MIAKLVANLIRQIADKIENNECALTEEELKDVMKMLVHTPLSKAQCLEYLSISRATFDNYVAEGRLPKGRKRQGFKELVWYQDEIDEYIKFFSKPLEDELDNK